MSYSMTDHAGDEQDGIERAQDRADEKLREERWTEFVAQIRAALSKNRLPWVLACVSKDWSDAHREHRQALVEFARTEGWQGVLNAIARAMQQEASGTPCQPSPRSEVGE